MRVQEFVVVFPLDHPTDYYLNAACYGRISIIPTSSSN